MNFAYTLLCPIYQVFYKCCSFLWFGAFIQHKLYYVFGTIDMPSANWTWAKLFGELTEYIRTPVVTFTNIE